MTPKYIILHHSLTQDNDTVSWGAIRAYHTQTMRWQDIGYHFGIELIRGGYEILMGRMPYARGAHCKQRGMNDQSLGICFVGNFDEIHVPPQQWELGIKLVRYLCNEFGISKNDVRGHRDFALHKSCPGGLFSVEDFRASL